MAKGEPSYTIGGNINCYSHYEQQYGGSLKKINIELPYNPKIPPRGSHNLKRYTYHRVPSSTVYKSKDVEAT